MSTGIQWTDETWNPVVGCTVVSAGCDHCYAATLHNRRYIAWKRGWETAPVQYHQPFKVVQLKPERLDQPLKWKAPRRIFVNSLSDLFHEDVPDEYILQVWGAMLRAERHTFQILTKRPKRMQEWVSKHPVYGPRPLPNVWLGVSVEHQDAADVRIPLLLKTPAAIRFLSCEPLIEQVGLNVTHFYRTEPCPEGCGCKYPEDADAADCGCDGPCTDGEVGRRVGAEPDLHWVIIGGESGPNARPFNIDWADQLHEDVKFNGAATFIKQFGSRPYDDPWRGSKRVPIASPKFKDNHGGDWLEWPEELRVREFPVVAS